MEKKGFIDLINHFASSQPDEAKAILQLRKDYPYSQVIQVLAARFGKDHAWHDQQGLLQSAAVYSTDRSVLKHFMTTTYVQPTSIPRDRPAIKTEVTTTPASKSSVDVAAEVMKDLKQLRKLKSDFESMLSELVVAPAEEEVKPNDKPRRGPGRPRKKKQEETADPLIEEIKTTKKKIPPANKKTKEQIEIIDNFIKAQPSITPKPGKQLAENTNEADDLTAGGDFADHVVSETLVEILKKQGKKDKAIEVLRKLIWKFPQKKAYFAAQIEELKK